jgi:DNA-binding Lrp family transcriptional regulator
MTRQARQELLPLDGIGVRLGGIAATSRPPAPRERPSGRGAARPCARSRSCRSSRELQADARRTNRDIAAPTTALDRTRGLRERGVIGGALLDVDLARIGRPVQAMIAVRVRPPKRAMIEAFRDWAATLPETVGVFVVSGLEDFLLHVAVADNEGLYAFVIDRLTERPEVADVRTSVVYEHIRNPRIQPGPPARNR